MYELQATSPHEHLVVGEAESVGGVPVRPRPWMCCCSHPWGPGTGLSGEQTSASVQAGKAVKPELPPATWTGRARHLQPFLSQQLPVLTALACEAATSPGCHPEPPPGLLGASSTGLRTVLWYKGQNSQASVTVATTTRGECGARGRGGPQAVAWDMGKLQWH